MVVGEASELHATTRRLLGKGESLPIGFTSTSLL